MSASKENKNLIKPYSLDFWRLTNPFAIPNYQIIQDLKDLKNASIKELTIYSSYRLKNKMHLLSELLRNTNIKKIVLELGCLSLKLFILLSKLKEKNTTINIEFLDSSYYYNFKNNKRNHNYFKETKISRLASLNISAKLARVGQSIFRNHNLNEIELIKRISDEDFYHDYIQEVFSSKLYLDEFYFDPVFYDQKYYDTLSKIKTKAEIDTLHIESGNIRSYSSTIENAYLFKTKTITIARLTELKVFHIIYNLSNNPNNTVKRIIFNKCHKNWNQIIDELKSLNLKDYDLKKLPKIFVHGYRELILDEINNQHSILFQYQKYDMSYFCLNLKRNSIEINSLTELLYILVNSPNLIEVLRVEYGENDMNQNTNPQYLVERRKSIILGIFEAYDKFKDDKIRFKRTIITKITFIFNNISPELNFAYFTILEIMVLMKIEIKELILDDCPISELVEFLDKHKSLDSLHIDDIRIVNCETIDKENIEKLYQYSHLIKNQILIDFNEKCIDIKNESVQIELLDIFNSKSRNYNNFVAFDKEVFPFFINALNFEKYNLSNYIQKIKNLKNELKSYNDIYFSKHIARLVINFKKYDLKSIYNQFSFLKEYEYYLNEVYFLDREKRSISLMLFNIVFETICNSKYKGSKVNNLQHKFEYKKFSKKCNRYLKLHKIEQ